MDEEYKYEITGVLRSDLKKLSPTKDYDGDHITISGEWSDGFKINSDSWRAVSDTDGKEYIVVIYNTECDVVFRSPE